MYYILVFILYHLKTKCGHNYKEITACDLRTTIPFTIYIHAEVILCHKCTSALLLIPFLSVAFGKMAVQISKKRKVGTNFSANMCN